MKTIEKIIELQKIDSQLQEIAELLGDLPIKVESLKEKELRITILVILEGQIIFMMLQEVLLRNLM